MHFSTIRLYNFGIYKGLHEMALSDSIGKKNITLVGGLNGRGKTTLLDAVFLCLYGRKSVEYITGKRTAYAKVLQDRINKSAEDQQSYVRLVMEMDDEEGTVIAVTRSWRQNGARTETALSVEKNGLEDAYLSENWEYYVEELIPFGIAKFFFFDNEKISQIADDEAFDKIKGSIQSVMGVTTIEALCAHIEKIRREKTVGLQSTGSADLAKEAEEAAAALEENTAKIKTLQEQRTALLPELERTEELIEQSEQEFWKKGGNLGFNRDDILRDQQTLRERIGALKEEALTLAANPAAPIGLCKELAAEAYNRIRSEEEGRARQASLPIITGMYRALIAEFEKQYPASSDAGQVLAALTERQLAALKQEAAGKKSGSLTPLSLELLERFLTEGSRTVSDRASQMNKEHTEAVASLAQLEIHLSSQAEKQETAALLNKIKELQAEKTRIEAEIARYDEQLHSAAFEQERLEHRYNRLLLMLAADADASDDNARIVEYATMSVEVMHEFVSRLQKQKVGVLEQNITSCFAFLAQKQGIITSISIDPDTLDITLRDYQGGILLKDQLSAGEKQMFAISILWGLAISSGYQLPVIIDTPMARLDSAHRSHFVDRYLPNASSQVVVLSTDEEINGRYLEDIRDHVNRTYTLVYDEHEKCSRIVPGYFGGDGQ